MALWYHIKNLWYHKRPIIYDTQHDNSTMNQYLKSYVNLWYHSVNVSWHHTWFIWYHVHGYWYHLLHHRLHPGPARNLVRPGPGRSAGHLPYCFPVSYAIKRCPVRSRPLLTIPFPIAGRWAAPARCCPRPRAGAARGFDCKIGS